MTRRINALILLSFLGTSFLTNQALALSPENAYDGYWYVGAGVGHSWFNMNSDNYISPCADMPDDHYYKNSIHDSSFVQASGGYGWTRNNNWFPALSLGLRYDYGFNGKVSGNINQFNSAAFQNYSYSYDFSRQSLMGIFKADIFRTNSGLMPFVFVGFGTSYNKASGYTEEPLSNVTPRVSPGYGSNSTYNSTYMVGAGVDYMVQDDIWITLEYNYADFGSVRTSNGENIAPGIADYSTQNLENTLRANSVVLSFTYLLNYV